MKSGGCLSDEVDLLTAIGNEIGVAVEKARLYQREREVAEQLRSSEQGYRELFETTHDASWLHDLKAILSLPTRHALGLLDELVTGSFNPNLISEVR